ncbi:MAG: protein-(glutamine-N5) methyltransferase, release factor-specific [Rhodospirillaceae bacterium]|mgnify:CR=1 FL=1|nr:protein-(glutamine-N5) methyltransferase, release factor-specific [Rhodospirillaceae bacterium]|tara:strand:+ start:5895 stop:6785 length:891 start_codon:yes stop_codon:yes gene_type:complete
MRDSFQNSWPASNCKIGDALSAATKQMRSAGIPDPINDSRILLGYSLALKDERFYGLENTAITPKQLACYQVNIERRCNREPTSRIIGRRAFWSLNLKLTPQALDPRPDSETLIESMLRHFPDRNMPLKMLDLGTGTGCLLLSALYEFPHSTGVGIDVDIACVLLGQENAVRHGLEKRAIFKVGNWYAKINSKFDVILCNPPYVPTNHISKLQPEVFKFEPYIALDGGPDGLDCYRSLAPGLADLLAPDGLIFMEIGFDQKFTVTEIMEKYTLKVNAIEKDLAAHDRCLILSYKQC